MADNATVPVQGTLIVYGTVGGTPATSMGEIKAVNEWPGIKTNEYDKTRINVSSTMMQNAPALSDPGQFAGDIAFKKADINTLVGISRVNKDWLFTFIDGSKWLQTGWLKEFGFKGEKGDEVIFSVVIRMTDVPTFTPAP